MEFSWFEFVGYRVLPERLSDFSVLKRIMRAAQKKNTWLRECILRRDACYFYLFFLSFEQRISSTGSKPGWLKSGIVLSYETCLSSFHRLCHAFHFFFFFVFFIIVFQENAHGTNVLLRKTLTTCKNFLGSTDLRMKSEEKRDLRTKLWSGLKEICLSLAVVCVNYYIEK